MTEIKLKLDDKLSVKKETKELEKRVNESLDKIVIWLGSKKEYEEYVGHEVEFISELFMGIKQPILSYPFRGDLLSRQIILRAGIEALVQAKPNGIYSMPGHYAGVYIKKDSYVGIPVKRKVK